MKTTIIYSSKTGNTKKIADQIKRSIANFEAVDMYPVEEVLENKSLVELSEKLAIGYWNDKGTADGKILELSKIVENKTLILFGTQGAYPESEHGLKCIENVNGLFTGNNILGHFLCQGKIDENLTKMFENLPEDHPHYMNEERRERHKIASLHPNEEDLRNVDDMIQDLYRG